MFYFLRHRLHARLCISHLLVAAEEGSTLFLFLTGKLFPVSRSQMREDVPKEKHKRLKSLRKQPIVLKKINHKEPTEPQLESPEKMKSRNSSQWSVGSTEEGRGAIKGHMLTLRNFLEDMDLNSPGEGLQALKFLYVNFLICILVNTNRELREINDWNFDQLLGCQQIKGTIKYKSSCKNVFKNKFVFFYSLEVFDSRD